MPNKMLPRPERTCQFCQKLSPSRIARRRHEASVHKDLMTPEQRAITEPYTPTEVVLATINRLTKTVVRGPTSPDIAKELELYPRTVRFRLRKLERDGLVQRNPDSNGYMLTEAGLRLVFGPR